MQRKGQAAMEFLMTYGWAILAAIIAIAVLAYFGVFSPGKFAPSATVVNPPFYANAWSISQAAGVNIELKNNGGETYTISSVAITPTSGATSCTADDVVGDVQPGSSVIASISCSGMANPGQVFKGDIQITYTRQGSALSLTSSGTIAGTISA